jgi:peptidyl-prolyl cis-trans isomerase D
MVTEFDQVAFSMQPGVVSDLIKTQYGFHIIKVVDKRAAVQKPLDAVRAQITEQMKNERAQTMAQDLANRMAPKIQKPADLDVVAKANGLTVMDSGFFLRNEPITGLGPAPELAADVFTLNEGEITAPIQTNSGWVIAVVTGKEDSHIPKMEEVKERVRQAVIQRKAIEAGKAKAESLLASFRNAADFEAAVKAAGMEVQKSADFVARGAALPGIGISPEAEKVAFALKPGEVSNVVTTDSAAAVIKLVERQDVTDKQLADGRAALRDELLSDQRGRFFASYMGKAKEKMKITIDREALQKLVV